MKNKRSRLALFGVLALALSVTVGLSAGSVADAKKKKGGGKAKTLSATGRAGPVPNGPTSAFFNPVPFKSTATIGKKGKNKQIANVEITVSVSAVPVAPGTNGIGDLILRLSGPNGATTNLLATFAGAGGVTGNLISNLTLTDNTPTLTCGGATAPATAPPPPCGDPDALLNAPYTGRAQPAGLMGILKGGSVKGNYTLTAFDVCGGPPLCGDAGTATITGWSIRVTPEVAPVA
jgi:hypothetical protein